MQDFEHNKLKDVKLLQTKNFIFFNFAKAGETAGRELSKSSAWNMLENNGIKTFAHIHPYLQIGLSKLKAYNS